MFMQAERMGYGPEQEKVKWLIEYLTPGRWRDIHDECQRPGRLISAQQKIPKRKYGMSKLIRFFRGEVKQLFCHRKDSVFIDYFINPLCRNA